MSHIEVREVSRLLLILVFVVTGNIVGDCRSPKSDIRKTIYQKGEVYEYK